MLRRGASGNVAPSTVPRVIGVAGVAFAAFNGVVGVGIFALPGLVASLLKAQAIIAYLACLAIVALVALCMAEAGSRVRSAGGVYAYILAAFGPIPAGVAGTFAFFASGLASTAALTRFLFDTVESIFASPDASIYGYGVLAAVFGLAPMINVLSTRSGARLTIIVGIMKIVPLAVLAGFGLWSLRPGLPPIGALPSSSRLGEATLLLFFAFTGIESATYLSGEVRRPAQTVPRAILLGIALIAVLYVALQVVAGAALAGSLAGSRQPLVDTARVLFGEAGAQLLLMTTILSVGGHIVSDIMCSPRLLFALAARGQLPTKLAFVHPRFGTPALAIICYPLLVLAIAASGTFRQIAVVSTTGTLLLYLLVCVAVLRLRATGVGQSERPFVVPGGPTVPLVASGAILWLLSGSTTGRNFVATIVLILVLGLIYAFQERRKGRPEE